FGTAAGTVKLIATANPAVNNGMVGANIVMWGGANAADASDTRFANYDATHGFQAAAMTTAANAAALQAAPAAQITDFNAVAGTTTLTGNASMQALRLRTTANTQVLSTGAFTLTLGSAAAVGQGAGLQLNHTTNDTVTHPLNLAFGAQEGLIYTATTGGTSGIVGLTGVISGTNGITKFGDGILRLQAANNLTGGITLNSGELRLNSNTAGGLFGNPVNTIDLWGGYLNFELANTRFNNDVAFYNDARLGSTGGFGNLTVNARAGSSAPVVMDLRGGTTVAYGSFTLNGPAQAYVSNIFQVNGGMTGTANLEKFGNERLFIGGDSSGYSGNITVNTGFLNSLNASTTALPFGTGSITINPGGSLRIAAPSNIGAGQVTMNSDVGGISMIGMTYVGDPTALPAVTVNSTAPWKGALGISTVGFSQNINQSTLWGGEVFLGAPLGDTGIYTGTLTPATGGRFLLGTGQGAIRIAAPLTGAGNGVVIGTSMTDTDVGRANQVVNNSGGAVQYDVPMTYGGDTIVHSNITLRLSAKNATLGLGAITLNGGTLQADSAVGQLRMIAPMSIANAINLNADSGIQMQNNASDFRITGPVNLASGSTGVVRQIFVGVDQPGAAANNSGNLFLDGGLAEGPGSSGGHFIKAGAGTIMLSGTQSYTGTTTVTGGLLGVNGDADLASSSHIILAGGGLGVFENSFTTSRNMSFNGGNGWLDVMGGLTLTQAATSTYDGANFIMKRGLGTLILNGSNAQVGLFMADGILQINNQAAFGDPARTGLTDIQFSGDQTIGGANNGTRYTGGTLRINGDMGTLRGITFNNNGNTGYSGGIDVTGANTFIAGGIIQQGTEFDFAFKTGTGALV
ncbi:MAG: autotransporter-associated beta strand repeat-containing protein, partial [Verrucomicrobiaceae bacterium]|nr:autotransporter-associated beta strand repeat-containing protein [Verrucomicrobiaceae bacterium]